MPNAPAGPRTDLDLDALRRSLEEERARLTHEIEELDVRNESGGPRGETGELSGYDQHDADQATETFLRERDDAIQESLNGSRRQVEAALHKLEAGSYGYCERCDGPIAAERLEILPGAPFCIECEQEVEARL